MSQSQDPRADAVQDLRSKVTAYRISQAIHLMVSLGIADELEHGPGSLEQIADSCGADHVSLNRVLRALVTAGLVTADRGLFALTPAADPLRSQAPDSIANWVSTVSREQFTAWGGLEHAVRTGEVAFERVHGISFWDHLDRDREAARLYDLGMAESAREACAHLLRSRDLDMLKVVCDLGGGHGATLAALLNEAPHLRGVLLDVPKVIDGAAGYLARAGVADRCDLVSGSFLDDVPSGADAYLLCRVLGDWDDRSAQRVLENCRSAMAPGARLWILGGLSGTESSAPGLLDLHLMVLTGGGERTEEQTTELVERAGLRVAEVVHDDHGRVSLVEAVAP
ncbi:methyltransferase [Nocardiopsis alba]|uniref:methyltransferase n=1 Tax=Nocardiopsis alba TaxID=53437 RepID=UPI003663DE24